MSNKHKAVHVANTFLKAGLDDGIVLEPMQLQMLMYLLEGWNLVFREERKIGEDFEARPFGPTLATVNIALQSQATAKQKNKFLPAVNPITGTLSIDVVTDEDFFEVFSFVWNRYKHLPIETLVNITMTGKTPWSDAAGTVMYIDNDAIETQFIELYYKLFEQVKDGDTE